MRLTLDSRGRIYVPMWARKKAGMVVGSTRKWAMRGNQIILTIIPPKSVET